MFESGVRRIKKTGHCGWVWNQWLENKGSSRDLDLGAWGWNVGLENEG